MDTAESFKAKMAERFKTKAEEKFKAGDLNGAQTLALKAHSLCSSLPDLHQMITAINVHAVASTTKLASGKVDWYAVLDIKEPHIADGETIKKQLNRMRLLTHPDKNHSAAAVGAFRLVEEAAATILKSSAIQNRREGKRYNSSDSVNQHRQYHTESPASQAQPYNIFCQASATDQHRPCGSYQFPPSATRHGRQDDYHPQPAATEREPDLCKVCKNLIGLEYLFSKEVRRELCTCMKFRKKFNL